MEKRNVTLSLVLQKIIITLQFPAEVPLLEDLTVILVLFIPVSKTVASMPAVFGQLLFH
jgi:hypothetical protein